MVDSREVLVAPQKNSPPGKKAKHSSVTSKHHLRTPRLRDSCSKGHCREGAREGRTRLWAVGTAIPRRETLHLAGSNRGDLRGPKKLEREQALTHFTDSEGAGVAGIDLGCTTPREIEELHQARYHLILLLSMAQAAVATKAPGEDSLL